MGKEQDLLEAARLGNSAAIERILNQRNRWTNSIAIPLPQFAASTLRKGVNPNCQDFNGETPLHLAALNERREAVETLLRLQASANIADGKGCFPLHLAAWRGNAEICQVLLTQGPSRAKVNEQNSEGDSALHSAAQYGHSSVVQVLLQHNADPELRNIRGDTPLDLGVKYGRLETVQLLLSPSQRDVEAERRYHQTTPLLHLAARHGHKNVVEVLLNFGLDINITTKEGSALHEAAAFGKIEVVKFLLERGIDTSLVNCQGYTVHDTLASLNTRTSEELYKLITDHIDSGDDSVGWTQVDGCDVENEYDTVPTARPVRVASYRLSNSDQLNLPLPGTTGSSGSGDSSVFDRSAHNSDDNLSTRALVDVNSLIDKLPDNGQLEFNTVINSNLKENLLQSKSSETPKKPPRKKKAAVAASETTITQTAAASTLTVSEEMVKVKGEQISPTGAEECLQTSQTDNDAVDGMECTSKSNTGLDNSNNMIDNGSSNGCTHNNNNNNVDKKDLSVQHVDLRNDNETTYLNNNSSDLIKSELTELIDRSLGSGINFTDNITTNTRLTTDDGMKQAGRPSALEFSSSSSPSGEPQPPTPLHSPPSPTTAVMGIQQIINPPCRERRRSRDIETSTEYEYIMSSAANRISEADYMTSPAANRISEAESVRSCDQTDGNDEIFVIDTHKFTGNSNKNRLSFGAGKRDKKGGRSSMLERLRQSVGSGEGGRGSGEVGRGSTPSTTQRMSINSTNEGEDWKVDETISSGLDTDSLLELFDRKLSTCSFQYLSGDHSTILTVGDWLQRLNLDYENLFITNGFDDMDFMCPDVLSDDDLIEIGIDNSDHRAAILNSVSQRDLISASTCETISDWLRSLRLFDYMELFIKREIVSVSQLKQCSEACLCSFLLDVALLGHRRRMEASLKKIIPSQQQNQDSALISQDSVDRDRQEHYEQLVTGCCRFTVQYLGSTLVSSLDGTDSTKAAISRLKKSMSNVEQVPNIDLLISCTGVKFCSNITRELISEHEIGNIFCVCQDGDDLNYLAYITRDLDTQQHYCHVFSAPTTERATELILTLGDAFEIAYQMAKQESQVKHDSTA